MSMCTISITNMENADGAQLNPKNVYLSNVWSTITSCSILSFVFAMEEALLHPFACFQLRIE